MKLLYAPFAIVAGIIGTRLGKRAFQALWSELDDSPEPPPPTSGDVDLWKSVGGAALQAAMVAAIATVVRRFSARFFHHLFGVWPEKTKPVPEPAVAAAE